MLLVWLLLQKFLRRYYCTVSPPPFWKRSRWHQPSGKSLPACKRQDLPLSRSRTEQSRDDEPTTDEQTIIKCNDFPQNPSKDGFSQGTKNRESSSTALTCFVPFRLDLIQVEPNQNKSIQKKETPR